MADGNCMNELCTARRQLDKVDVTFFAKERGELGQYSARRLMGRVPGEYASMTNSSNSRRAGVNITFRGTSNRAVGLKVPVTNIGSERQGLEPRESAGITPLPPTVSGGSAPGGRALFERRDARVVPGQQRLHPEQMLIHRVEPMVDRIEAVVHGVDPLVGPNESFGNQLDLSASLFVKNREPVQSSVDPRNQLDLSASLFVKNREPVQSSVDPVESFLRHGGHSECGRRLYHRRRRREIAMMMPSGISNVPCGRQREHGRNRHARIP